MAVVNSYVSLNTIDPSAWYGQVYEASSTRLVVSDGFLTAVYDGYDFRYSADYYLTGGVLTGYSQYDGDQLASETYDFQIPAHLADGYIASNRLGDLFSLVLAGDDEIFGSVHADRISGYDGNDYIYGNGGDDYINGAGGDDVIYLGSGSSSVAGGAGLDWVVLQGVGNNYRLERFSAELDLYSAADRIDATLTGVERLQFDDGVLALDLNGNAGQVYRLYQAAFERTPDNEGLKYWIGRMDEGNTTLVDIADSFLYSPEFVSTFGTEQTVSDAEFVDLLYTHTLGRDYDQGGYNYWVGKLAAGETNRRDLLAFFSESNENKAQTIGEISDGIWLY
ncbi:DUF4214 domain-containing protein [Devosia sp. RR2S18]|uniref:DUF4214 domain-containing protein n=1 Tax=Devosia rhizosphaerae TaxID=3049774 RepID=UPI0025411179|nr:DUF4214 domain-containing protein [Devosia sp. RR2S18]WIJ24002.1 DUF4214 domain-containing protein [Devosia sp. RR2S18]